MTHRFCSIRHKILLLLITILSFQELTAQYYYNDLLLPQQNKDLALYRTNKVKKVNIISTDANNRPSEDFSCQIVPDGSYSSTKMISKSGFTSASILVSWYTTNGLLQKTVDSAAESITTYTYQYNSEQQLIEVTNTSISRDNKNRQYEKHMWTYENGIPVTMLHIRNNKDTLETSFVIDEHQKVVEEITRKALRETDRVFYYYDDKGRLSDVVRYNIRLQQLVPDFMFEYNNNDQLIQLISVTRGSSDYVTWKYSYLSNGLKSEEVVYNKQKQLMGRMKFEYDF